MIIEYKSESKKEVTQSVCSIKKQNPHINE